MIRDSRGIGLVEVMITVLVLSVGFLATLAAFVQFGEASFDAQRRSAMVSVAQKEIERIRSLPYAQIGLAGPLDPAAAADAPLAPAVAAEGLVSGGVVRPGADTFALRGITGKIYRYVTWRSQACPLLKTRIATQLSGGWGQAQAEIEAALADLCPGAEHTKRITVVVRADAGDEGALAPVTLSSVAADPDSSVLANGSFQGLHVDASPVVDQVTGGEQAAAYASVTPQQWHLTDTPCTQPSRQPPSGDHESNDTAGESAGCAGPAAHDLMVEPSIPGAVEDALHDVSTDVHRPLAGGLAMRQDTEAGDCADRVSYPDGDEVRRGAIHTWATPPATQTAETPASGGRATLTFWTQTAAGETRPARLCMTLRRSDTGAVLGTALYALPAWPDEPTQLAVAFDVAAAQMPAGTRLLLTLRNPSDGESDVIVLYDHPAYQSSLSVTMVSGSGLS